MVRAGFVAAGREWLPASTVTYTVQYLLAGEPAGEPAVYSYTPGGELPSFASGIARFAQSVETDEFIVTARYTALARLPADARLRAALITEQETVADYTAQYREAVNSKQARLQALLDIGFWVGDAEVQPAAPVEITVQLLGEDGLPSGAPLMVVHFGQQGTEVIESRTDEKGSAAFRMAGFSPVGIGLTPQTDENGRALLNEGNGTFEWADPDGLYHVTFTVCGVVAPKPGQPAAGDGTPEPPAFSGLPDAANPSGEGASAAPGTDAPLAGDEAEAGGDTRPGPDSADPGAGETAASADTANIPLATASLLQFHVGQLAEQDAAYAAYAQAAQQNAAELLNLDVMQYSLTYGGVEMDLASCEITIMVAPTVQLEEMAKTYSEIQTAQLEEENPDGYVLSPSEKSMLEPPEPETGILFSGFVPAPAGSEETIERVAVVVGGEDEFAEKNENILFFDAADDLPGGVPASPVGLQQAGPGAEPESGDQPAQTAQLAGMAVVMRASPSAGAAQTFAVDNEGLANPAFTVKYFANLDRVIQYPTKTAAGGINGLAVINTDNGNTAGTGGSLPVNGLTGNSELFCTTAHAHNEDCYVREPQGAVGVIHIGLEGGAVKTEKTEVEIYSPKEDCTYITCPDLPYFNKLYENKSYELALVRILDKDGKTVQEHEYDGSCRFTNRTNLPDTLADGDYMVGGRYYFVILQGCTIELVFDPVKDGQMECPTTFLDYDISESGWQAVEGKQTLLTANFGINGAQTTGGNAAGRPRYAFGNANTGVIYRRDSVKMQDANGKEVTVYFNQANRLGGWRTIATGFGNCSFGLVTGMEEDGTNVIFNSQIAAPKDLFVGSNEVGKHVYQGNLVFGREGDTYTLAAANAFGGGSCTNLDTFRQNGALWENSFWPLDDVPEGQRTDPLLGRSPSAGGFKGGDSIEGSGGIKGADKGGVFPTSDDGIDHNFYLGMRSQLTFKLDKDYIGPLEYYFFGDDDMWVFLSRVDENGSLSDSRLICDIGGIHSAVGEYVNLWNWIRQDTLSAGEYALTFFYTERGGSGSNCWMRFTLPSVAAKPVFDTEKNYGRIVVSKEVESDLNGNGRYKPTDNGETFRFRINLKEPGGDTQIDNYSYELYNKDGTREPADFVLHDGSEFWLKAGQYIVINSLPVGTQYTISEIGIEDSDYGYSVEIKASDREEPAAGQTITGTVQGSKVINIAFHNRFTRYELPKTGGTPGAAYIGAGAALAMLGAACTLRKRRKKPAEPSAG